MCSAEEGLNSGSSMEQCSVDLISDNKGLLFLAIFSLATGVF
jgi:hypothetical protein